MGRELTEPAMPMQRMTTGGFCPSADAGLEEEEGPDSDADVPTVDMMMCLGLGEQWLRVISRDQ